MIGGMSDAADSAVGCSLGDLAARVGWSSSDVLVVSGVSKSSLARWWSDPDWLEHAVPGVREYVSGQADRLAVSRAVGVCDSAQVEVAAENVHGLLGAGVSARELVPALLAGAALAQAASVGSAGEQAAVSALSRCWGAPAERAVDALFVPADCGGVFVDPTVVAESAQRLQGRCGEGIVDVVGRGIALHKLIKHFEFDAATPTGAGGGGLARAFRYRSSVIGRIFADGDEDAVRAYRLRLLGDPVLRWNEVWSLATYAGDFVRDDVVRRPVPAAGLVRTAGRLLDDLVHGDDSYRTYLLTCAVPLLLSYDPTFGEQRDRLNTVATGLAETGGHEGAAAVVKQIRGMPGTV